MSKRRPKLKTFRVLYAVTFGDWFEIMAPDEDTARRQAFRDGKLIEIGDVTDVVPCEVEEVRP